MTLAQMATLLLEPRTGRYVGRHRAPDATRFAAVAAAPRTLVSAVTATPAGTAPRAAD